MADAENVKAVLDVMRVAKVKPARAMRKSCSSGALGNSQLALCDGSVGAAADGLAQVEALEASFESLRALGMEIEAQT